MKICISAATTFELAALQNRWPEGSYQQTLQLRYLVTGIGPVETGVTLTEHVLQDKPDLLLNIGLAGALDRDLSLGEVVHVVRDEFGDVGAQDADGSFIDFSASGLVDPERSPFRENKLHTSATEEFAKQVHGVTVSLTHGEANAIRAFRRQTDAQVETMEGAAAMLVALRNNVPFVQLRAISNFVEPRNRSAWQVEKALLNLTEAVDQLLSSFPGTLQARSAKLKLGL